MNWDAAALAFGMYLLGVVTGLAIVAWLEGQG